MQRRPGTTEPPAAPPDGDDPSPGVEPDPVATGALPVGSVSPAPEVPDPMGPRGGVPVEVPLLVPASEPVVFRGGVPVEVPLLVPAAEPVVRRALTPTSTTVPEREVSPEPTDQRRRWIAAACVAGRVLEVAVLVAVAAGAVALRVHLASAAGGPVLSDDELGYLANARWLAGVGEPDLGGSRFYSFGYSILLVPFVLADRAPADVVAGAQVLNAVLAALVAVPLAVLCHRAWPSLGSRALWIGVAVTLTPPLLLQPAFVWPETLLPLLFAAWAAVLAGRRHDRRHLVALVALAVALFAVHDRTIGVVVATGLVVAVELGWALRRRAGVATAAVAAGALIVGVVAVRATASTMVAALWGDAEPANADRAGSALARLHPTEWGDLVANLVGQGWYIAASTAGLAVVGVAVALGRGARASQRTGGRARRDAVVWVGVLAAAALVTLAGAAFTGGSRVDHAVYGRYNDLWSPVLVALGLGWLVARRFRARLVVAALAVPGLAAIGWMLLAVLEPGRLEGNVAPVNVLGLVGPEVWLRGTYDVPIRQLSVWPLSLAAGAALAVLALAAWRRVPVALALAAPLFVGSALAAHHGTLVPFRDEWSTRLTVLVEAVEDSGVRAATPVAYDTRSLHPPSRKVLQFWLGDDRVVSVDGTAGVTAPLVVSDDASLAARCYTRIAVQAVGAQELWQRDPACVRTGGAVPPPPGIEAP